MLHYIRCISTFTVLYCHQSTMIIGPMPAQSSKQVASCWRRPVDGYNIRFASGPMHLPASILATVGEVCVCMRS